MDEITVQVIKYDGAPHRRWRAHLKERREELLILDAAFEEEVNHSQLGLIRRGTVSIEYYWLERWYNVFRFLEPDGSVRNFYCNVNMPPALDGGILTYVDLDMDILVAPDLSYEILDMDEFSENAERYGYTEEVLSKAGLALDELQRLIRTRAFPFDC
jgi:protein associated with RNAse G/E